ncbi:suppressor of cytokine signaling 7-like isoform X6 [Syngnathoides biaculeatus]|uniref:suppressor of cytokine signaling 7-like isoform X6 n=1 Tax=Syngnathoides biaculeatus TaxID=300417 RepID=UPI002ADE8595|nr:suppressor of cytokine signaling 7-like isoform X6 [Syngnathoides biaculeatus]
MFCRLAASLAGVVVVFLLSASSSRARFRGHVLGSPPRLEPQPTMSDQMSPDFVLMRLLVSAAEYEHLEHLEHQRERVTSGKGGLDVDSGGAPAGPGSASPHYGSPLEGGPLMSEARPDSEDSSLPAEEEEDLDFPGSTGSRAQLMVFRNRMLDFGLEQPPPPERKETRWVDSSESASGSAGDAQERDVRFVPSSDGGSHPSGSVLCHPLGKWSPLSLLESRSNRSAAAGAFDPGPDRVGCREGDDRGAAPLPRCSRLLATGPGEDPSQTSDALLVLEGLGEDGGAVEVGTCRRAGPVFSSGTLSGLMQEVHRLSGVCPRTGACLRAAAPGPAPPSPAPEPRRPPRHQSRSQPQSRATTPKLGRSASPRMVLEGDPGGDRVPWGKPGKAGSLKLRLSKLFRTKSSCGGAGGLLDKRPSLTSSDAWGSAGLWGSACGDAEDGGRPQTPTPTCTPPFTGETVSLVDVEISRRNCLHPPTPPPPPRRSLSLLDDLGAPPPPRVPSSERFGGSSIRSLPPRPLGTPPPLSAVQHSRSLNVRLVLGSHDVGGRRGEAEGQSRRLLPGARQFRPSLHPQPELQVAGRHAPHPHGALSSSRTAAIRWWSSSSAPSPTPRTESSSTSCAPGFQVAFAGLPPTPVQLLHPVSRLSRIKSLQHLCRFRIRQLVRVDHIQELPLPTPLIAYLRKFYYYDPEEEAGDTPT